MKGGDNMKEEKPEKENTSILPPIPGPGPGPDPGDDDNPMYLKLEFGDLIITVQRKE